MKQLSGALFALVLLAGCASPGDPATSTPSSTPADIPDVVLPAECAEQLTDFLVAIEPIVADVNFEEASEAELESIFDELEPAGEAFDPDACPDADLEESRAAWLALAQEVAPGTIDYVEYIYPE